MTLEEAIKHCEEVISENSHFHCQAREVCTKEHKQLLIWLKELKWRREKDDKVKE